MRQAHLHECSPPERKLTEALIKDKFLQSFGADLHALMPHLITLGNAAGELLCAIGLRDASLYRLYMEQYLDRPVELSIADLAGSPVDRARAIDVGNLAAMASPKADAGRRAEITTALAKLAA